MSEAAKKEREPAEPVYLYGPALAVTSEDKKAETTKVAHLLIDVGVPYMNLGPDSEAEEPYIHYGYWDWRGLKEIKKFIERWKAGELPQV